CVRRRRGTESQPARPRAARSHRAGNVHTLLFVLMGAAGCLLAIACANVGNLLLARWSARTREQRGLPGPRAALGSSRFRPAGSTEGSGNPTSRTGSGYGGNRPPYAGFHRPNPGKNGVPMSSAKELAGEPPGRGPGGHTTSHAPNPNQKEGRVRWKTFGSPGMTRTFRQS